MKISFDLDGVITDGANWFFNLCEAIGNDNKQVIAARARYYSNCKLKYHPSLFMSKDDKGFILTARKTEATTITGAWLDRYGIRLPVYYIDGADNIDWRDYAKASIEVAKQKAKEIKRLRIEVHFDNNRFIVEELRKLVIETKIILIG